jgi:hypothetical protein
LGENGGRRKKKHHDLEGEYNKPTFFGRIVEPSNQHFGENAEQNPQG